VIAGVVDTGDKFIAGGNDTGEQLSPRPPMLLASGVSDQGM
jgi:hypothetical protein